MRWGLIPFWAKEEEIGNRMINARAETVKDKPSFRNSLKRKRSLVLADFFHEWQKIPGSTRKQPMCIQVRDREPFVFAGPWDAWKKPDDGEDAALDIASALIQLVPEHPWGWVDRSYSLHELKRTEEARDNLLRVVEEFPENPIMNPGAGVR